MQDKPIQVRGIRGATTVAENKAELVYKDTKELLKEIMVRNDITTEQMAAIFFSSTKDLNSAFPARAAREMGWLDVPLFCQSEIDVPGAMPRCVRVLILVNTTLSQKQIKHVYLKETINLRQL